MERMWLGNFLLAKSKPQSLTLSVKSGYPTLLLTC